MRVRVSPVTTTPPSPHDETAWSAWARSGLDVVVRWVSSNPDDAGRAYQDSADLLRAMRERLCAMRYSYDTLPAGASREAARALLCGAVGRYARYAHLIYGGTGAALAALYPPGSPPPCRVGDPVQGRLDVCAEPSQRPVAQPSPSFGALPALPPALAGGLAVAVVLVVYMRTDLARAEVELTRIQAIADAHARGVPTDLLAPLAQPSQTLTEQVGGAVALAVGALVVLGGAAALWSAR